RREPGQELPPDEVLGQGRRLGPRVLVEVLGQEPVEVSAVDQVAPAQVPDEPFARAQFSALHGSASLTTAAAARAPGAVPGAECLRPGRWEHGTQPLACQIA